MCVVSMVTDTYMKRWPQPASLPVHDYTFLKELIRKAEEYDRIMEQPNCPDLVKADWWREVQKRKDEGSYKWVPDSTFKLSDLVSTMPPINLYNMPAFHSESTNFS